MSTVIRASVLAACVLLVGSADAAAQIQGRPAPPRNGVCFYDDVNYGGDYFCTDNDATNGLLEMNDRISSIRIFGNAEVTVYQDRNFSGRAETITADVSDLRPGGWNDTITSFRVQPRQSRPQGAWTNQGTGWANRWGRPATPANGACFYENVNFEGQYFCSRQGESVEMVPEGANDRISSIRLFGNAEIIVYRDREFAGTSQWFDVSEPDLRESGWNDTISSYRIENRGAFGRGRGNAYGRGYGRGGTGLGYDNRTAGSLEWRGYVDNRVQLVIRGRSIQERTLSGNRYDEGRAVFASALPAEPVNVTARRLSGRGDVRVIQQPSRQNGYTAIVEIYDPTRGAQEQRIEVNWR